MGGRSDPISGSEPWHHPAQRCKQQRTASGAPPFLDVGIMIPRLAGQDIQYLAGIAAMIFLCEIIQKQLQFFV
jgi:hypothetical protein